MCLVALAWNVHPRWRLLLAGNRDEFHARLSAPLAHWPVESSAPGILAGRDLQSGGTWAGVAAGGRAAVVTNVRDPRVQTVGGPSRGELVAGFLVGEADAPAYAQRVAAGAGAFAPFNLLVADARSCSYVGNHPEARQVGIAPGIHGMSNGRFDQPWPKTRRLCAAMDDWIGAGAESPDAMWSALADETLADDDQLPDTGVGLALERTLSPAFIRGSTYGTRASTVIAIDHQGSGWISERRFGPDGVPEGETTLPVDG